MCSRVKLKNIGEHTISFCFCKLRFITLFIHNLCPIETALNIDDFVHSFPINVKFNRSFIFIAIEAQGINMNKTLYDCEFCDCVLIRTNSFCIDIL